MLKLSGLACGLALATAGVAVGQQVIEETTTITTPPGSAPAGANPGIRRITQLIGSNVALPGNNNFGRVEDVVMDNNGGPGYLVVSNGGRYAMLPWGAANINYGQRVVNYNVAPQAIQPLFFERNAWPNISDQQFTTRMTQVFPGTGVVRREELRPVEGVLPGGPPAVIREKIKVKPNGDVKVKERVR